MQRWLYAVDITVSCFHKLCQRFQTTLGKSTGLLRALCAQRTELNCDEEAVQTYVV
jgi:hypothetical protein